MRVCMCARVTQRRLELQVSRENEGRGLEVNTTLVSLLQLCPTIQPVSARAVPRLALCFLSLSQHPPGRPPNDASSLIH